MKRIILITILALCIGQVENAMAATVQVYPTIRSAHGGTANAADMRACLTENGLTQCDYGVPTFTVPAGDYQVQVYPAPGYSASLDSACAGTIGEDDAVTCNARYEDGAPIAQPAPQPTPQQPPAPQEPQPAPQAPAPTVPQETVPVEPVKAPEPQIIIKEVTHEVIREVPVESTTTAETKAQVQQLETRVGILEVIVNWIQGVLASLGSFFGL